MANPGGTVIAFFDVDNTLLHGASLYHLGKGAFRRGLLGKREIVEFAWKAARFRAVGENLNHLDQARSRASSLIGGRTVEEFRTLAHEIFDRYTKRKIWPETMALAQEHLDAGHQVWLITTTPDFLAEVIAERLGLTGALGTPLEVRDGVFTGGLVGGLLHGIGKLTAAETLTQRLRADPLECYAYSDSANDLPLLQFAGHAVAVNPDVLLAEHARANGWPILRLNRGSIARERRRVREQAAAERPDKNKRRRES